MAIDQEKLRATAERLISENGADCTFVRKSRTPADPTRPWRQVSTDPDAAEPAVTIVARAVVVPIDEKDDADAMRRGDATGYVAADTFGTTSPFVEAAMEGFDFMCDALGVTWRVKDVQIIAPGALRIVYQINLMH